MTIPITIKLYKFCVKIHKGARRPFIYGVSDNRDTV